MKTIIKILLLAFVITFDLFSQQLPDNAIFRNFRPFTSPRTNGRPGEVYRINEEGKKYIVQDIVSIKEKRSEEGDLIGRMYFSADELLTLLNLEFDRVKVIPVEVKILKAIREYNEQTTVDKILYENGKIRELIVDSDSKYFIIRETILSKDIAFRFSHEIVKKIKRGANALKEVKTTKEEDFPFEIRRKFKQEKRIFYLDQPIKIEAYDD